MKKIDTNADGAISLTELLNEYGPSHKSKVETLFKKHDKNSDNKLSKVEFTAFHADMSKA